MAKTKDGKLSAFNLAAAYIGAIVGVSFSSGQELLTYFGNFGKAGMIGCAISFTLFALFGPICLFTARRLKRNRYDYVVTPFPEKKGWNILRNWNLYVRMFFMFGAIASMAAGAANILSTRFGVPYYVGAVAMLAIGLFCAIGSQKKLVGSLSFATPLMVALGIILCTIAAIKPPVEVPGTYADVSSNNALIGSWVRSAFLYFGYNISLSISVLSPMAENARDDKACIGAGIITGIVNGGFALICVYALIRNYSISSVVDMPTIEIAFKMSPIAGYCYSIVALLAIFTTLVGILSVFKTRLGDMPWLNNEKTKWLNIQTFVIFLAVLSYALSFVGFKKLTNYFFPFSGYCAITFVVGLLFNFFWSLKHPAEDKAE